MYEENQRPRNKTEKNTIIKDLSRAEAEEVVVVAVVIVEVLVVVEVVVVG